MLMLDIIYYGWRQLPLLVTKTSWLAENTKLLINYASTLNYCLCILPKGKEGGKKLFKLDFFWAWAVNSCCLLLRPDHEIANSFDCLFVDDGLTSQFWFFFCKMCDLKWHKINSNSLSSRNEIREKHTTKQ